MANGTTSRLLLLALLLATVTLAASDATDDYFYDEEVEEESMHVPTFSSKPLTLSVMEGDTVNLPCYMDKATAVITWQHGPQTLFTGTIRSELDQRFKLADSNSKGISLQIADVQRPDSGVYKCTVSSSPTITMAHTVNVKYAPTVTTSPDNGVVVIKQGSPATMRCTADGYPQPTITWTKKGGLLPNGEKKFEGDTLHVNKVDREDMGNYICTVANGVGKAVVKDFRLEVNFPPEIETMSKVVHTGAGYEAQLSCKVLGQPLPKVTWRRTNGAALESGHHQQVHEGVTHGLTIDSVKDTDMGTYSCRAESTMGTADATIELTGKPTPVVVSSDPNGKQAHSYTLHWKVESYAPVEEYNVIYETTEVNSTGAAAPRRWEEIVIPDPSTDDTRSVMYTNAYTASDLQSATVYQATVTAKNKYGWSEQPAKPFEFATLGANDSAADLRGGGVLGLTDPTGSAAQRTGLLACLGAILALAIIL